MVDGLRLAKVVRMERLEPLPPVDYTCSHMILGKISFVSAMRRTPI